MPAMISQSEDREGVTFGYGEVWPQLSFDYLYFIALTYIIGFAFQGFAIYLVIIWSRLHNRQFDQPTSQSAAPAA
jgi:hypothetical protein